MGQDNDEVIVKSVLLAVMFIVSAIFIGLPIGTMQLRRVKEGNAARRKFILSLLNCFGGGIFVSVGFLHLLPEVVENMESAFDELLDGEQEYPFAYFVVCIGFLIVLLIEHLVLSCEGNKPKLKENEASFRHRETNIRSGLPGATASGIFSQTVAATRNDNRHTKSPESTEFKNLSIPSDDVSHQERVKIANKNEMITYSKERSYSQSEEMIMKNHNTLHAFTVALALSVHSIFEGLAFGLQDTISHVLQVFLAIIIHKAVLAFSLGINFLTAQVRWKTSLLLTLIFCLASPVGGAIGTVLASSNGESVTITLLNAILSGIATGTFFYVAFVEVISYEMKNIEPQYKAHRLLLVLAIVIGFTIFAALSFMHDHDHHNHDHDHSDHDHGH